MGMVPDMEGVLILYMVYVRYFLSTLHSLRLKLNENCCGNMVDYAYKI